MSEYKFQERVRFNFCMGLPVPGFYHSIYGLEVARIASCTIGVSMCEEIGPQNSIVNDLNDDEQVYCAIASMMCCLPITIPGFLVGCLVGCGVDIYKCSKNALTLLMEPEQDGQPGQMNMG